MLKLTGHTLREMARHAEQTFPEECCGIVLEGRGREEVYRVTNVQASLHSHDPDRYPRQAKTAYFMDPKELANILKRADSEGMQVKVIYHSHPDHEAYFSSEDRRNATAWDEPIHPTAFYLVLSVWNGVLREARAFGWDGQSRDFVEVPFSEENEGAEI